MKIYLAGSFRNIQSKEYLDRLASKLDEKFEVFLSYREAGLVNDESLEANGVVDADLEMIAESQAFVAVLDESYAPGTHIEMGVAHTLGKRIIVLNTKTNKRPIRSIFVNRISAKIVNEEKELVDVLEVLKNEDIHD